MDPITGGLISGGIQGLANAWSTHKNIKANKEMAQYQYSKNLEQWNRENEYNTPAMQRKRLEEAGMNPVEALSKGTAQNTSSSSPQYQAPTVDYKTDLGIAAIPTMINQYQDFKNKQAQNKLITAQARATDIQAISAGLNNKFLRKSMNSRVQSLFHDMNIKSQQDQFGSFTLQPRINTQNALSKYQYEAYNQGYNPGDQFYQQMLKKAWDYVQKLGNKYGK